jgi:serine/threonine protein kinase
MESSDRNTRWVHILREGQQDLVLLKILGAGVQSQAQLVQVFGSDRLIVRKVSKDRLNERDILILDPEIRMVKALENQAHQRNIQANIIRLISSHNNLSPKDHPSDPNSYFRVSYWDLYNGGDLHDLYEKFLVSGKTVPTSLILHFIKQIGRAIHFMHGSRPSVWHNDLNLGNIFLQWPDKGTAVPDFYVGDFGFATFGAPHPIHSGITISEDIAMLYQHANMLINCNQPHGYQSDDKVLAPLMKRLFEIAFPADASKKAAVTRSQWRLLEVLQLIPESIGSTWISDDLLSTQRSSATQKQSILQYYHESLSACRAAREVDGPWVCAQARIDPVDLTIIDIPALSGKHYLRPPSRRSNIHAASMTLNAIRRPAAALIRVRARDAYEIPQ